MKWSYPEDCKRLRPGYYVEGRFFRDCRAQAIARAKHLSRTQGGRMVEVSERDCDGTSHTIISVRERPELVAA